MLKSLRETLKAWKQRQDMLAGRAFDWPAPPLREFLIGKPVRPAEHDDFVSRHCVARLAVHRTRVQ